VSKEPFHSSHSWKIPNKEKSSIIHNELERQICRFLKLGFHTILDQPIEDYLSSMPQLPQDEFSKSFDKLVIVEPRIPTRLQLMQAGFNYYVQDTIVCQTKTSKSPYIILLEAGINKVLREVQAPDENSLTIQEGASLLVAHPEVIDGPPIALFGTKIYSLEGRGLQEKLPCTYKWSGGKAGIGSDLLGYLEDDNAQAATCTRLQ